MADAEHSLRVILEKIAEEQHYDNNDIKIKSFVTNGANYTSGLFFATISAPNKDDLNLFAKVAMINDMFREKVNVDKLFGTEQLFYNKLVHVWEGLQDKYNVAEEHRYYFPKFYGGSSKHGEETVVLENLVTQGYGMYSRFKSVDWEFASNSIETLAKFHALSFVYEKEYPEEYNKIVEEVVFELPPQNESMQKGWENMMNNSLKVLKEEDSARVRKFLESGDLRNKFKEYNIPRGRPILVHADYRPSNLLSKKRVSLDYIH